nr:site-specific integrase [Aquabacterium sp. A08]
MKKALIVLLAKENPTMSSTLFTDVAHAYCASTARPADSLACLRFWIDQFGQRELTHITPEDVDAGLLALKRRGRMVPRRNGPAVPSGQPMAETTLTRYAADLGGLYRYAKRQRLVSRTWTPPTKGLETVQSPQKLRYITAEGKSRLVALARALDRRWGKMAALIEVAFSSGWRAGNLQALTWADVDLAEGLIQAENSKTGIPLVTPISSAAVAELKKLPNKNPAALVFGNKWGAPFEWRKLWAKLTKEAGLEGHNFHLLRHGAASTLAANGASQAQIMAHLGHSTLAASRRYLHLNVSDKQALAARVFG